VAVSVVCGKTVAARLDGGDILRFRMLMITAGYEDGINANAAV
jgi:hypothetical protein